MAKNSNPRFLGYGFKVFGNPDAKVPDFGGGVFLAFSDFQKLSYPQPNDVQSCFF